MVLMMPLLLASCSGARIETKEAIAQACPHIKPYSKEMQKKVAGEIEAHILKCCPGAMTFLKDFKTNRDQSRICRSLPIPK